MALTPEQFRRLAELCSQRLAGLMSEEVFDRIVEDLQARPECGSIEGYNYHERRHEMSCRGCMDAYNRHRSFGR